MKALFVRIPANNYGKNDKSQKNHCFVVPSGIMKARVISGW